jgi:HlyD family secretion protein
LINWQIQFGSFLSGESPRSKKNFFHRPRKINETKITYPSADFAGSHWGYSYFQLHQSFDDANFLRFTGNIEVTEAQMSFRIPGRLEKRLVEEGDTVTADQLLASLEKSDQKIALDQAKASLAYAEAILKELEAGSRKEDIDRAEAKVMQAKHTLTELRKGTRIQEIESARADLDSAKAAEQSAIVQLKQARTDYSRYTNLYKEKSISKSVLETYQNLFVTAENEIKEAGARTTAASQRLELLKAGPRIEQIHRAEAALQQAEAEYVLVKAGPRKESIDQARAKHRVAAETLNQAGQQLIYTELFAPMDAVVLSTAAKEGEFLNPASPVLTLGRIDKPWLRAYIHETDLGRIKLGRQVEVTTDTFPGKIYSGRVSYISSQAEFTPKTVQTFEERVKLMYRIKGLLDNPDNELKPGMPADGRIDFSDR